MSKRYKQLLEKIDSAKAYGVTDASNTLKDLKSAKSALKFGNKKGALILYKRAFKFKKSLYVKTKIKELS